MTDRQDERDASQDARGESQDARELSQAEWMVEQQKLVAQQTENINVLATAVGDLALGLNRRPTLGKVVVIIAAFSLLSNLLSVGFIAWTVDELKDGQVQQWENIQTTLDDNAASAKTRGETIISLTERLDDCLDTTVDDGDPIGKCAAESQARTAFAISQITSEVTCAVEAKFIEFLTLNPELEIGVPAPRAECDAEGDS